MALHDCGGPVIVDIQRLIALPEAESFRVRGRKKASVARADSAQKVPWVLLRLRSDDSPQRPLPNCSDR